MLETMKERLYRLLPSLYRQSDQNQGYALWALMNALESEFQLLEADMDGLYDNWFIETVQEWVVSYIGDLLGVYDFSEQKNLFFRQRRRVANTIGYRRRKGLPAILEHVAQDVTGWPARVGEYRQLLATTQHLAHRRLGKGALIDVCQTRVLEKLEGPFETSAHNADVRHIGSSSTPGVQNYRPHLIAGKYQVESLGLFMWRLQSYQLWENYCRSTEKPRCTIRILDNGIYTDRSLTVLLPENSGLVIEATHSLRPTISLVGNLNIKSSGENAQLTLSGLAIGSKLSLQGDMRLDIAHCTLMPFGVETHRTMPRSTKLQITIDYSIVGPLRLSDGRGTLHVKDSIVDGLLAPAISTLTTDNEEGIVSHLELAREVIFTVPVFVQQRHRGQVRCR